MKTVLIYVNTSKRFGDPDHLKVFANVDAAETWFEENDAEGVAFEYEVLTRLLHPAMRLRRRSLTANYAAGVFVRDSQGVSTKKTHTGLAYLKLYGIVYITGVWRRQVRRCTKRENDAVGCHVSGFDLHRRAE